jgi:hypothetical protein
MAAHKQDQNRCQLNSYPNFFHNASATENLDVSPPYGTAAMLVQTPASFIAIQPSNRAKHCSNRIPKSLAML